MHYPPLSGKLASLFMGGTGDEYSCRKIDNPPNDRETIMAEGLDEAVTICALLSEDKNWLGGVPGIGGCG